MLLALAGARNAYSDAEARFHRAEEARQATALTAVASGLPKAQVADALGVSRQTVFAWVAQSRQPA